MWVINLVTLKKSTLISPLITISNSNSNFKVCSGFDFLIVSWIKARFATRHKRLHWLRKTLYLYQYVFAKCRRAPLPLEIKSLMVALSHDVGMCFNLIYSSVYVCISSTIALNNATFSSIISQTIISCYNSLLIIIFSASISILLKHRRKRNVTLNWGFCIWHS